MVSPTISPAVTFSPASPADVETDLLLAPVLEGEDLSALVTMLDGSARNSVARAVGTGELQGKPFELFLTPAGPSWKADRLAIIGCGKPGDFTPERLRRVATAGALAARQRHVARVAFLNRVPLDPLIAVRTIAEGLVLSAFSGDQYKSADRSSAPSEQLLVVHAVSASTSALERAVERGRILGESCNIARDLCNEPSNVLTPSTFANRAAAIASAAGVGVQILDEREIQRLNMGLLVGVAKGSAEPPRLIVLRHQPAGAPMTPVLGLVGKGITFDTGGISIKPADGMERMKGDMAGGAAVICAMRAISLLEAPIQVIGVVPTTENMPGGRAIKPGDVLTGASGKTVEVINTDAEGRLILGDGLWYAQQLGATHLVDVATLTGACVVALGKAASGLFGQPDDWVEVVRKTASDAGDRCWPLPLYDEYNEQLRSEIADLMNSGGRPAGACTAAVFLKEFATDRPWAHLDIAGTSWSEEAKPWQPKGPTGVAVRTLTELAFTSNVWQ